MATIKSFTDVTQSKVLAEFLPLKSADCYWEDDMSVEFGHGWHSQHIPCWSLAALLGVLPNSTDICKNIEGRYYVHGFFSDNPVDACVDAIKALHELNLL